MTTLSASSSDPAHRSSAFGLLHPRLQRWVWQQQWTELRDAQERAIPPILAAQHDVLIAATTASGKTEAAFLPICSALVGGDQPQAGIQALYVSPLKALINDQHGRLDALCEHLDLPVHRWHGDVDGSRKAKVLDAPAGLLLITPESLEAMFVIRGPRISSLFGALRYVVIDEMHTFIGTERGAQLRSLLHRIELSIRRHVPRIGLSATLGDMDAAAAWLRPSAPRQAVVIVADDDKSEIKLQLRGYLATARKPLPEHAGSHEDTDDAASSAEDPAGNVDAVISQHLFATLRGADNLVFANSRQAVETYADLLARRSERERVPNEFPPHHGSLSKDLREHVESRLKDRTIPVSAICTSTLEMGIDIGSVTAIAQVGPPPSVSALRQRLGRSGRRGDPQILRLYCSERENDERTGLIDRLRTGLVQSVAMIELLLERWYEPPDADGLHLSTLIQQLLSMIAQHGGVRAQEAYVALCGRGPFQNVPPKTFAALLRSLGARDVITQETDGLLLLGGAGERIVNHYSFYAAFRAADEYRLLANGKPLGTLPIDHPITIGELIIFAGRRWRIVDIDVRGKTIELTRSSGGRPPMFAGNGAGVHDAVRKRMLSLYRSDHQPIYLDATAQRLLAEGRRDFARHRLDDNALVHEGQHTHIVSWRGDRILSTLSLVLAARGLETSRSAMTVTLTADPETVAAHLTELAAQTPPDPLALAGHIANKVVDKWDELLDEPLLDASCAVRDLDVPGAWNELAWLADHTSTLGHKSTG